MNNLSIKTGRTVRTWMNLENSVSIKKVRYFNI